MKLEDFIKELFGQSAIEGYMLGSVEINLGLYENVTDNKTDLVVTDVTNSCAKITIIPSNLPIESQKEKPKQPGEVVYHRQWVNL